MKRKKRKGKTPHSVNFIHGSAFLATPVAGIEIPAKVSRELGEGAVLELDGGFDDLFGYFGQIEFL
jgi:hypothetical protein